MVGNKRWVVVVDPDLGWLGLAWDGMMGWMVVGTFTGTCRSSRMGMEW